MKLALRIDDIGASSKRYEVYSKWRFGNIWFLKHPRFFGSWAPYSELTADQWRLIFDCLRQFNAKLTVGITACWVDGDGSLIPFVEKFPSQAAVLKTAFEAGLVEIANHGLTHCVIGRHLPRFFCSNRKYHREFWPWLDVRIHFKHMEESQKILRDYFGVQVTTFIPPGNVFSEATVAAAERYGISLINCHLAEPVLSSAVRIVGNDDVFAFHDRELVLYGIEWLRSELCKHRAGVEYCFVGEL